VARIFGQRPKRQKHISALIGALATGCKAPGLYGKKPLRVQSLNSVLFFELSKLTSFNKSPTQQMLSKSEQIFQVDPDREPALTNAS
jgi:hypothetical protein